MATRDESIIESIEDLDLEEVVIDEIEAKEVATTGVASADLDLVMGAVASSKLLVTLRSDQLEYMFATGTVGRVRSGHAIPSGDYQVILSGRVSILHSASDTITYLGEGEVIGPERGFAARADVDVATLSVPRRVMDHLCDQSQSLGAGLDSLAERRARHLILGAHEVYAEMRPAQRAAYLREHQHVAIAAGTVLVAENEPINAFTIVLDGALEAVSAAGIIGSLRGGDVFGHFEILSGTAATATVTAQTTARLAQLPRPIFLELISSQPTVLARLTAAAGLGDQ